VVLATHGALPLGDVSGLLHQVMVDLSVASWTAQGALSGLIRRWRPAVVHAHQANSVSWHAVRAARAVPEAGPVPVVVTAWGSDVLHLPERSPLHRWMVRYALQGAAAWTADAQALLDAADRLAGPCSQVLRAWVPIGIDEPTPPTAPVARERRLLSCRLHKRLYRIDAILRAFAHLPADLHGWVLEVAATGEETAALKALAAELNITARIDFTGMLTPPQLLSAYRRSALFVSVPESDGTSVSLLEAMFAGCLPVLSDLPANREWVQPGKNGLLVADMKRLHTALAEAIAWFESGRWDIEGRPANEARVRERALFSGNIRQFQALYLRLPAPAR
jgi:glycosyltransferase involved in cell wall biosynthesis